MMKMAVHDGTREQELLFRASGWSAASGSTATTLLAGVEQTVTT
jgi:hypothetical protein